jgi:hypothetical protein
MQTNPPGQPIEGSPELNKIEANNLCKDETVNSSIIKDIDNTLDYLADILLEAYLIEKRYEYRK